MAPARAGRGIGVTFVEVAMSVCMASVPFVVLTMDAGYFWNMNAELLEIGKVKRPANDSMTESLLSDLVDDVAQPDRGCGGERSPWRNGG